MYQTPTNGDQSSGTRLVDARLGAGSDVKDSPIDDLESRRPSRRPWLRMIERMGRHASLGSHSLIVVHLAPDLIGELSESAGPGAREVVLTTLAGRLRQRLGTCHALGQAGEHDLMIVRWAVAEDELDAALDELHTAVREETALGVDIDGRLFIPRAFCGVAISDGTVDGEALLHHAELALAHGSRSGRRWQVHEAALSEAGVERLEVCMLVDAAVVKHQIDVAFQPILSGDGSTVVGVEALARFRGALANSDVGRVIVDAEATGSIVELGSSVFRSAAATVAAWSSWPGYLAINVSPVQLATQGFGEDVFEVLVESGLPASRLVIEVTESAMLDDADSFGVLTRLRAAGIRIAVDDFGKGRSSISRLHHMPIDILKIDRELVSSLPDPTTVAIIRTIHTIGTALGVTMVAEGVEQPAQFEALREIGPMHLQGFLFSIPSTGYGPPVEQEANLIARQEPVADRHSMCTYDEQGSVQGLDFVAAGLLAGEWVLCIVDPDRLDSTRHELERRGVDAASVESSGQLSLMTTTFILDSLVVDGVVDNASVVTLAGPMLEASAALVRRARVRRVRRSSVGGRQRPRRTRARTGVGRTARSPRQHPDAVRLPVVGDRCPGRVGRTPRRPSRLIDPNTNASRSRRTASATSPTARGLSASARSGGIATSRLSGQ